MRVLFISENFPYPLDSGGRIRTFHILKGLSQEHDITLLTTIDNSSQYSYIQELKQICHDVRVVESPNDSRLVFLFKILKSLFSSVPFPVAKHYLPALANEISSLFTSNCFDVVHFDHLDASVYLPYIPSSAITVLDEHNIVSNQIQTSLATEANLLKKFYMQLQLRKSIRYEATTCTKITRCFVCSDADKESLLRIAREAKVITIPNGVDLEYFCDNTLFNQTSISREANSVIFVGMLNYGPGEVAVRYFCESIFPILQQSIPDIRFYGVGHKPPQHLQELVKGNKNIILTGGVPDIRPYIARCKVFVVPLKSGSGTRLKILSAMAMGIPVVSTSIGAEGLDVTSGKDIMLVDTPEAFSSAVLQLLCSEELADEIRTNAIKLVRKKYAWKCIWTDLLEAYRSLSPTGLTSMASDSYMLSAVDS